MKKVLITGAKGQLGVDFVKGLSEEYDTIELAKEELNIINLDKTINIVREIKPNIVINAAAYTNVDKAEKEVDLAYQINALGARNLAVACLETQSKLVHISTDFVFDGERNEPYIEFDKTNPLSTYGKSKLAGEELIKEIHPKHFIFRTSWLYGKNGNNFIKTMLRLAKEKKTLKIVNDQKGTPTYTKDLVEAIKKVMETDAYGIYHTSNEGECTWYEFAKHIFEILKIDIAILPITTKELNRLAKRPAYSVMRNYMLDLGFNYKMRNWKSSLKSFIETDVFS